MSKQLWTDEQLRMSIPDPWETFKIIRDTYEKRIQELEAQLRGTWQPVEDGYHNINNRIIIIEGENFSISDNGEGADVDLPDDIRLCRKVNKWLPVPPLPLDDDDRQWAIDTARAMGMDEE